MEYVVRRTAARNCRSLESPWTKMRVVPDNVTRGEGAAMTTSAATRKRENVEKNMCKGENGNAVRKRDNAAHR